MPTLQQLIDNGCIERDAEGTRECGVLAMWVPVGDIMLMRGNEFVANISQEDDGLCINTSPADLDFDEYEYDHTADLNIDVYQHLDIG